VKAPSEKLKGTVRCSASIGLSSLRTLTSANKGVFLWLLFSIAVVLKSGCKSAKSSGMLQDGFHRKLTPKVDWIDI
jgi:hypothetical protein